MSHLSERYAKRKMQCDVVNETGLLSDYTVFA
jgi:hypothetical protein